MSSERNHVLVVEDHHAMSGAIRLNLERAGFRVTVVPNGRVALDLLNENRFDFVITDFKMPEMNGDEFVRGLRQDERHANVPVLMCTAWGFEIDVDRLQKELSIFKILTKPFSPSEITEIVRSTLAPPTVN